VADEDQKLAERRLVQRILKGDEEAFLSFYNTHKKRLARTAAHFLGYTDPAVEDVIQDTFAAAYPQLKNFRFESTLYTWLNRFTVNFCFQVINKRKKTLLSETEKLEGYSAKVNSGAPDLLKQALLQDIESLEKDHQDVVRMKDIEGRSYIEIADTLGLAPGTVMSRLSRARTKLRERIDERKEAYAAFFGSG
jgi:RNA polymerase sigma-70 factor (ECF subfamily)